MHDHPEEEQAAAGQTVGSKVNAIIEAAEEAAKEIRDRANLEAIELRKRQRRKAFRSNRAGPLDDVAGPPDTFGNFRSRKRPAAAQARQAV